MIMKNSVFSKMYRTVILLAGISILLMSCATSGQFSSAHLTNVELAENNYRIVAVNVKGEASARYILGVSASIGGEMNTFALIPLKGERLLYQKALENLWQNFETQHNQSVEGSSLALINIRYDAQALNVLVFYTEPSVSIRADVIEFED